MDALDEWTGTSIGRLRTLLDQRGQEDFVRECHGDLHLGNAKLIDGKVVLFDCIEFNEPFRLIDVASDAAFLAMDLEDRGQERSEEHTSELQSLMRSTYAVFCLIKKKNYIA